MAIEQMFFLHVETALLALVALGMCMRRRVALCRPFFLYVLAVFVEHVLQMFWWQRFRVIGYYTFNNSTFAILKFLTAIEIWSRTFSTFPRGRARVGLVLAAALLATAVAVALTPPGLNQFRAFVGFVDPRLQAGSLFTFAILASAVAWYRVPMHPFHRAVLLGFAVYLSVHAAALSMLVWLNNSPWARHNAILLEGTTYVTTLAWWTWAAWRPVRVPTPMIARLHPWARSW
jgi:hypothetical protein